MRAIFGLLASLVVAAGCAAILDIPADRYTLVGYEPLDGGNAGDGPPDGPAVSDVAADEPAPDAAVDGSDAETARDAADANRE